MTDNSLNDATCNHAPGMKGPLGMVFSADGTRAYVAAYNAPGVTVLKRDATTGELTALGGPDACFTSVAAAGCAEDLAMYQTAGVALSPDGKSLYATSLATTQATDPVANVAVFNVEPDGSLSMHNPNHCYNSGGAATCTALNAGAIGGLAPAVTNDSVYVPMGTDPGGVIAFARAGNGGLTQKAGNDGCVTAQVVSGCALGIAALTAPSRWRCRRAASTSTPPACTLWSATRAAGTRS